MMQDERFTVRHTPGENDWTLAIKFVNQRDQGVYVCQVTTGVPCLNSGVCLIFRSIKPQAESWDIKISKIVTDVIRESIF